MQPDLEKTVRETLVAGPPPGWAPSGYGRELYVDLSEPLVRQAAAWQNAEGRIMDPWWKKAEPPTGTARFAGALGFMIRSGRCLDLVDACARAMTVACQDLHDADTKQIGGAEFYPKELMVGYLALEKHVDAGTRRAWKNLLGGYDPEKNYNAVLSKKPAEELHNFCTFALAGEACKKQYGIADNSAFMEKYLETQKPWFTECGMYRDPNDPMTYDGVARMNLALMLHWGYQGAHRDFVDDMLRKGAMAQLLYMSSSGECPYGGRSNQQNFNEAMIALLCEYEAVRYHRIGDAALAGAFKRMAKLAALSVRRWLEMKPPRFNKNGFPVESQHGRQQGYGFYSTYSLLIASQFGFAHLLADDTIEERPAPCEIGGYVWRLPHAFHKVFATCGGYHVEIDTNADLHYDATGLGRVHRAGVFTEMVLSTPIPSTPGYLVSRGLPPRNVAIGPGWKDREGQVHWLADQSDEQDAAEFKVVAASANQVCFTLTYGNLPGCEAIVEEYRVDREGVLVTDRLVNHTGPIIVQVPLLLNDGRNEAEVEVGAKSFGVRYKGESFSVECLAPGQVEAFLEAFEASNRNGVYKVGCFCAAGNTIAYRLALDSCRGCG